MRVTIPVILSPLLQYTTNDDLAMRLSLCPGEDVGDDDRDSDLKSILCLMTHSPPPLMMIAVISRTSGWASC